MAGVKCRACGKYVDKKLAYKFVNSSNRNEYYCTQKEYEDKQKEKELKDSTYHLIFDVFGCSISNSLFYKEMNELLIHHTMQEVHDIVKENLDQLTIIMSRNFNSNYGKIRYFFTVIERKLDEESKLGYKPVRVEIEIPDVEYNNFKSRQNRTSLETLELEVGDDY